MGYNYNFSPIFTENRPRAAYFNYNYMNYKHLLDYFYYTYNLQWLEAFFFSIILPCSAIQNAY